MAHDVQRIGVLFSRLSGYMAACLKTLRARHDVALCVFRRPPVEEAPFAERHFDWIDALYDRNQFDADGILKTLEGFNPQALFISGWMDRDYLRVARALRSRGVPVVAGSDAQWTGSWRQQVGRLVASRHLHTAIDVLWVAGERQRRLAEKLGYRGPRCWDGVYACDWERFADTYRHFGSDRPRAFLYVGRYVPVKGLDVLVEAYRVYRSRVSRPWPLVCIGAGPQQNLLAEQEGIHDKGFVQPDRLPEQMGAATALVLPSKKEAWGVVVQEAAAAGLPVLCTEACGASVHLVRDGYNGYVCETGNSRHLACAMQRLTELASESWEAMSRRSHNLSRQYTPQRWADTLVQGLAAFQSMSLL